MSFVFCDLRAQQNSAYEQLMGDLITNTPLVRKQKIITHYLFRGVGAGFECNKKIYQNAWAESGIKDEEFFSQSVESDLASRLLASMKAEERIWHLQVVSLFKESKTGLNGKLPVQQLILQMIKHLKERSALDQKPVLGVKILGNFDLPGMGIEGEVNAETYSFYEITRWVFLSTAHAPPVAYLSYPDLIIEGRHAGGVAPTVSPPPVKLFEFMRSR
jgi:hypothetical protein